MIGVINDIFNKIDFNFIEVMKLIFFFYFWRIYDRNIFLDVNLYFFGWMSEDLYNRRGCLKYFENFLLNFIDKLYVIFEKKGGGIVF